MAYKLQEAACLTIGETRKNKQSNGGWKGGIGKVAKQKHGNKALHILKNALEKGDLLHDGDGGKIEATKEVRGEKRLKCVMMEEDELLSKIVDNIIKEKRRFDEEEAHSTQFNAAEALVELQGACSN